MSGSLKDISENEFNDAIQNGLTLVDFWAPWCGPCKMQTPILEKVAEKVGNKVQILKVNVDNEQNIAAEYGIQSIPTLILFKNGAEIRKMIGLQNETSLVSLIESN